MNNSELKKLYNTIMPTQNEKNEMQSAYDSISNIIKNNIDGNVKVAELRLGGSFKKGTIIRGRKEIDIVVAISPKNNKKLYYKDLANLSMNSIENSLYLNYYDKLKEVGAETKILRNYTRNTLSLKNTNDIDIDFLIKFKKDHLLGKTTSEIENFYLERDEKQLKFIDLAHKKYSLFKNVVMLIKHFRNDNKLHELKSYMIEIMLYYSLTKYCNGSTYCDYLTSFFKGMKDFIDKKTIEVDEQMYSKLEVKKTDIPKGTYKVVDVANRSNNVAEHITEINSLKKFYEKYKNSFTNDTNSKFATTSNKSVNCSITYVWHDKKSFSLQSEIKEKWPHKTDSIENNKKSTFETIVNDFHTHLSRIISLVHQHNFEKNIVISCSQQLIDIFTNNIIKGTTSSYELSKEEKNKFDQLKQKIENDGIILEFKPLKK